MVYAVNLRMRRWALAPTDDGTHTILLASFLTPANGHGSQQISSSFVLEKHDLALQVALFLERSAPALNSGNVTLHVVHDDPTVTNSALDDAPCVVLHHFPLHRSESESSIRFHAAATDRRWPLYRHVLRQLDRQGNSWDCAWAVDLTDVVMLRLPPCAALPEVRATSHPPPPPTLHHLPSSATSHPAPPPTLHPWNFPLLLIAGPPCGRARRAAARTAQGVVQVASN